MGKSCIILIVLMSGCHFVAKSQQEVFRFMNFNFKDGLASRYTYSVTQDKRGYIWLGSGNGLYRFNGKKFDYFRSNIDKPGHSISNALQGVYSDKSGNLWLGSINDLQWYNPDRNFFWRPDEHNPIVKKILSGNIYSFMPDSKGDIWIVTQNNFFFRFHPPDSSFHQYEHLQQPGSGKNVYRLVEGKNGRYYALMPQGLLLFSSTDTHSEYIPSITSSFTNAVFYKGQLLITTYESGILSFDETKKTFEPWMNAQHFRGQSVFYLLPGDKNELWVGSYPLFRIRNKEATEISSSRQSVFDMGANKIGFLFLDREKNLWVSSHNGLSLMCRQNQSVISYKLLDTIINKEMEPNAVIPVNALGDFMVAGFQTSGLFYYEAAKDRFRLIVNPHTRKSITAIIEAPDGKFYCTDDEGFYQFNTVTGLFSPYNLRDEQGKNIQLIGRSCYDRKGYIYMASAENGFYVWEYPSGRVRHNNIWDVDKKAHRGSNTIYPCITDREGNVWFSSPSGVYEFKTEEQKFYHHLYKEHPGIPLLSQSQYIAEDHRGHKWITTLNNGLYELWFENGEERVKNYSQQSGAGLPTDYLYKIKSDASGKFLWIASSAGILRFDVDKKKTTLCLDEQRGLHKDDAYSLYLLPGNKLVTSYYGLLNKIDWENWVIDSIPVAITFNSIKVMDKEYVQDWYGGKDQIKLSYDKNYVQLDFSALHYNNGNQINYSWQLMGVDPHPVSSKDGSAVYAGLQPGQYRFKVSAATADGYWNTDALQLLIVIQPPFWKQVWFILLVALMGCVLLYYLFRRRISAVRREARLKESYARQVAELELKALRAQMNPHFIFNSLNSIQKYILKNDTVAASQYLTRFSRLIRLILDHSDHPAIELSSEIELIKLYCEIESQRFNGRFSYSIMVDDRISVDTTIIPSMLIQPYLENAIWHGLLHKEGVGRLTIDITLSKNDLIVEVDDDGIGRTKALELKSKQTLKKKSYGLQVTQHRMDILNKHKNKNASCRIIDKYDNEQHSTGTKVILTIPVSTLKKM